jgi:hypothetical protein
VQKPLPVEDYIRRGGVVEPGWEARRVMEDADPRPFPGLLGFVVLKGPLDKVVENEVRRDADVPQVLEGVWPPGPVTERPGPQVQRQAYRPQCRSRPRAVECCRHERYCLSNKPVRQRRAVCMPGAALSRLCRSVRGNPGDAAPGVTIGPVDGGARRLSIRFGDHFGSKSPCSVSGGNRWRSMSAV